MAMDNGSWSLHHNCVFKAFYAVLLLLILVIHPAEAAWWQSASQRQRSIRLSANPANTDRWRKLPLSTLRSTEQETDETLHDVPEKRSIEVTSQVELPFSAEVAYDAYSNLTRQPSWSAWLHSVDYLEDSKEKSKWTISYLGLKYSWEAIALKNEPPHTIQWKSTSGLQNFGTVRFLQDDVAQPTLMTMKMTIEAPRAAAALFRRSNGLKNFVQEKMITASMTTFRDVVLETNLKENQQDL
jgi:uncharacterized membrane protein